METADMPLAEDLGAQRTIPSFPYANLGQDKHRNKKNNMSRHVCRI